MTHCENTRESRLNIPSSTSLLPKSVTFRTLEACCYRNVFDVNAKISLLQTPVSRIMKWEGTQRVAKHVCVSLTPPSRVFRPWINPGTRPEVAVPHLFAFRGLSFLLRDRARFERHYRRATTHEQDREGTRCFHGIGLVPSGAVARCARRRDAAARALFGADT